MGAAETGQVIGWGQSAFSAAARRSDLLLHTTVRLVERQKCEQSHSGIDPATMMCAGDELADACLGDSGGPLLMTDQNLDYFLVGLVSWGDGCARRDKPGVYVRVSHYFGWIQANLNK